MNASTEIIARLYKDYQENKEYLETNTQVSLLLDYKDHISKVLLLCIASFFEEEVKIIIHKGLRTHENVLAREFLDNKALKRQYHALFDWTASNANQFFRFFGEDFKRKMEESIRSDDRLNQAIKDFLFLGNKRNEMVHENYAIFYLDSTTEDIFLKYESAQYFLAVLERKLCG
jgi:hypothetical protein